MFLLSLGWRMRLFSFYRKKTKTKSLARKIVILENSLVDKQKHLFLENKYPSARLSVEISPGNTQICLMASYLKRKKGKKQCLGL